jgi:hypothetical protein
MDNHCCLCGAYLADTSRMICYECEKPKKLELTKKQAIEMLKNPTKYMFVSGGNIELEGWLQEAIKMGIEALSKEG